jgi:hypothetical protein
MKTTARGCGRSASGRWRGGRIENCQQTLVRHEYIAARGQFGQVPGRRGERRGCAHNQPQLSGSLAAAAIDRQRLLGLRRRLSQVACCLAFSRTARRADCRLLRFRATALAFQLHFQAGRGRDARRRLDAISLGPGQLLPVAEAAAATPAVGCRLTAALAMHAGKWLRAILAAHENRRSRQPDYHRQEADQCQHRRQPAGQERNRTLNLEALQRKRLA